MSAHGTSRPTTCRSMWIWISRGAEVQSSFRLPASRRLSHQPITPLLAFKQAGRPNSGGAHGVDEILHLELELAALARQELRRLQNFCRCRAGLVGIVVHVGDVGRHLRRALRRLRDVVSNL